MNDKFYTEGSNVSSTSIDSKIIPPMGKAIPLVDNNSNDVIVNEVKNGDGSGYSYLFDGNRNIKMNDFVDNTPLTVPVCRPAQIIQEQMEAKDKAVKKELEKVIADKKREVLNEEQTFINNLKFDNSFEFGLEVSQEDILSGRYSDAIYNIISKSCYDIKTNNLSAMFINFHLYCKYKKDINQLESRLNPFLPSMMLIENPLNDRKYDLGVNPQLILDENESFNINSVLYMKIYKDINGNFKIYETYSGSYLSGSLLERLNKLNEFKSLNDSLDFSTGLELSLGIIPIPTINVLNILIPIDIFFPSFYLDNIVVPDGFTDEFYDSDFRQFNGKLTLESYMLFYTDSKEEKEEIFNKYIHKLYSTQTNKFVIIENNDGDNIIKAQLALSDSKGLCNKNKDKLFIDSTTLYNISNYKIKKLYKILSESALTLFKK